ncbi:DUF333 domain-containing protein [Candidatus Falkowbacteria bacterium]|nr:DUF333 domain-containing protein [Candidatus Falkowbacteria bacterium]
MFDNITVKEGQARKTSTRLFVIFLLLGLLALGGCIFQAKQGQEGDNNSTTSPANNNIKDGLKGKVLSTPKGSQYDDYFVSEGGSEYGLEVLALPLIKKINEIKDKDKEVILYGEILTDVADYGGQQILVDRIEIPGEDVSLTWKTETNEDLGISFQYAEDTDFEIIGNAVVFDGWEIEVLNNPKNLEFENWLNSNYAESETEPCKIEPAEITLGEYPTFDVSIGEGDKWQELGFFAVSPDNQKVLKLLLTAKPDKNYKEIIKTLRFINSLTKEEIDLNEAKKNGENGDDAEVANPASVFCEEQGGKIEFRIDKKTKGTYGVCIFENSECEEWAFYRGECTKGDNNK